MSILSNVTRGRVSKPPLILVYGPDGVGKTALAAGAPAVLFLGAEAGTDHLDVARLPVPDLGTLRQALTDLTQPGHPYKTVAIDTLDWLESQVHAWVIKKHGKADYTSIEDFPYGKGRVHCLEVWRELVAQFEAVRASGVGVVLLAHSMIKKFDDPATPQGYERYQLKLQSGAASDVAALMREFVDTVGFLNFETLTTTDDKRRAFDGGSRLLHVQRTPAFDAKNRLGLPAAVRIPDDPLNTGLAWKALEEAIAKAAATPSTDTTELEAEVASLAAQVSDPGLREKAQAAAVKAKGSVAELAKVKAKLLPLVSKGKERA
jgi:hypothetical protein